MIKIKEPFYTAGKKYGWMGKPIGLGINLKELEGEGDLEVTVGDAPKVWVIDKEKARRLIETYQSYHDARGTRLGVIAWHEFQAKES